MMPHGEQIDKETGLPREYVSCPSCGFMYGYQNRMACVACNECSKCCRCCPPVFISGHEMKLRAAEEA